MLTSLCEEEDFGTPENYQHGPTFHHSDGRSSQVDYFLIHKERPKTICKVEFERKLADLNTADHLSLIAHMNFND